MTTENVLLWVSLDAKGRRVARRTQIRRCFHIVLQKKKEEEEQNEREKDSKLILKCTPIHLTAIFGHE